MFCPKCGTQLKDNARFCEKCGAPVSAGANTENDKQIPPNPSVIQQMPKKTNDPKRGVLIILLIVIILLLTILLSVSGYFLIQRNTDNGNYEDSDKIESVLAEDSEEVSEMPVAATESEGYIGERQNININIHQVDSSKFPEITFYANITDDNGVVVEGLNEKDFIVQEIDINGNVVDVDISEVNKVINDSSKRISMNLVLDASGSMSDYNKMDQAKAAAIALLEQMNLSGGDAVEIISFDDYVYLNQDFTNNQDLLVNAINAIPLGNSTALYDGLYAGLYQTYYRDGVKCVVGFTDGLENASSYTFEDVVTLAQNTGIPVFIIGIGEEYDAGALQNLAQMCSGKYYSANVEDLQTILEDIYISIYKEQQDSYTFRYTSTNTERLTDFRNIMLNTSPVSRYDGNYKKEYIPQADVAGAFSSVYMNKDFILDFSSQKEVTESDLAGLSLAELRIARNEIFARHGRQFKDNMLNQWFYSKVWYLNLPEKYSPDDFDKITPSPLSDLERNNTEFILNYEKALMDTQDIFPNASNVLLSDYDLALSKQVLKNAMAQIQSYPQTDILTQNIQRIQQYIDREDVEY